MQTAPGRRRGRSDADCAFQFDPVGSAKFTTSCDIAKSCAREAGDPVHDERRAGQATRRDRHGRRRAIVAELRRPARRRGEIADAQIAAFDKPDAATVDGGRLSDQAPTRARSTRRWSCCSCLLVLYVTMVYGPIAAWLVELFPARIRYTSMSLPYHIGNGWFGGFLPTIAFAMVAATGDIYYGLWYPVVDRARDARHRHRSSCRRRRTATSATPRTADVARRGRRGAPALGRRPRPRSGPVRPDDGDRARRRRGHPHRDGRRAGGERDRGGGAPMTMWSTAFARAYSRIAAAAVVSSSTWNESRPASRRSGSAQWRSRTRCFMRWRVAVSSAAAAELRARRDDRHAGEPQVPPCAMTRRTPSRSASGAPRPACAVATATSTIGAPAIGRRTAAAPARARTRSPAPSAQRAARPARRRGGAPGR